MTDGIVDYCAMIGKAWRFSDALRGSAGASSSRVARERPRTEDGFPFRREALAPATPRAI